MKFLDYFNRKRTDRIKARVRKDTAKYYIAKGAKEAKLLNETYRIDLAAEKKKQTEYYEGKMEVLNERIDHLTEDNKFYRKQYKQYCDLKIELERVSGVIDVDKLHQELNRMFVMLQMAKDKVEIVSGKHQHRKLISGRAE